MVSDDDGELDGADAPSFDPPLPRSAGESGDAVGSSTLSRSPRDREDPCLEA